MNEFQRTYEWFNDRIGCLTASHADAVIPRQKNGKPYKAYEDEMNRIIAERITGTPIGVGTTEAMQWGIDHEDEAKDAYELATGNLVVNTGFILHPSIHYFGASPDGLVGSDGLIEIKCPNTVTHLSRIAAKVVPEEYKPQMLVQLLCTGRRFVDFVDFDPRIGGEYEHLQFWTIRYEPTEEELQEAEQRCVEFLEATKERMASLLSAV